MVGALIFSMAIFMFLQKFRVHNMVNLYLKLAWLVVKKLYSVNCQGTFRTVYATSNLFSMVLPHFSLTPIEDAIELKYKVVVKYCDCFFFYSVLSLTVVKA